MTAPDSAITRMMAGPAGDGVLDLSIGEPDLALPELLVDAGVTALRAGRTGYSPKLGIPDLREAVARDTERRTGASIEAADVVITVGGSEAVAVAIGVTGAAGIVVPDPAWPNYRIFAGALGIPVSTYAQGRSGDDFFDLPAIERALAAGARLVVVNSPSNPTGAIASANALERLVALARRFDANILSDEAYEAIVFGAGHAPSSLTAGADLTFSALTFSKTYSMTGLRVGALVSPPRFRVEVAALHGSTVGAAPTPAQETALVALRELPDRGAELAAEFRTRFRLAAEVLGPWMAGVDPDELGGFYLWLGPASRPGDEMVRALEQRGVLVSNGAVYSSGAVSHLRVALTAPPEALARALTIVRAELEGASGHAR